MRDENAIQKPVGSPIEKQYQEGVNPSYMLFSFLFCFTTYPSWLSCLLINMLLTLTTSEAPLDPPRALGPSRLGARLGAHGSMAWFAS